MKLESVDLYHANKVMLLSLEINVNDAGLLGIIYNFFLFLQMNMRIINSVFSQKLEDITNLAF